MSEREDVDTLRTRLRACQALLFRWFDEGCVDVHNVGCPEDDTCGCAEAAELRACLKGMT